MVCMAYYPPDAEVIIQIIRIGGELLTIPVLLFILFSFFFSLIQLIRTKDAKRYLVLFIINTVTILFLVIITIIDLNHV